MLKLCFQNFIVFCCCIFTFILSSYSQVTISGPSCGVAGNTSNFSAVRSGGNFVGVSNMQWCVTGGTILQAYGSGITGNSTCKTGTTVNSIVVLWNSGTTGSVSLTTPVGNANKVLTMSYSLNPGSVSNTSQTINYNSIPATINCSVATYGFCTPSYQYQWQKSTDNVNWTDVSGATAQNLSSSVQLIQTTYFRRQVFESNSSTYAYSNTATVFVNTPFSNPTISPASQDMYSGESGIQITLTGPPTGGSCSNNYSYYWQTSTDGVNFTDNGTNGNVPFNPSGITSTKYYRLRVVCGTQTAFSNISVANVYAHLATPSISPSTLTIPFNTIPSFTANSPTGGKCGGLYSYQWQKSLDNITFSNIVGANAQNYTPERLMTTTYFRRVVTCNPETVSATVTVTVNPEIFVGTIAPGNLRISSGTSPGTLSCTPANGGSCNGNFTYQWQNSSNGTTYQDISGATNLHYNGPNLTASTYYRMKISCGTDIYFTNGILVSIKTDAYVHNFVQSREITKPQVTTEALAISLTALRDVKQTTQYFDGLGRLVQTVIKQGSLQTDPLNVLSSSLATDLVQQNVYDDFGREVFKYLPFVSTAADATKNDGGFKIDPFKQHANFYLDSYSSNPLKGQQETWLFSQTNHESSPLMRVEKTLAPGNSWQGSDRSIKVKYWSNTNIDEVRIWTVTNGTLGTLGGYGSASVYSAGSLYKTINVDENGKQQIEFKDKEGKVILKKIQLTAAADNGAGSSHSGWICTYYIYDNLSNLRCVIQPKGVELISPNWALTDPTILAEQCFRYEYDYRGRMIIKKVPGADQVYMVHDIRDRLVLTQDANLRSTGKWRVILYDVLNRPFKTGIYNSAVAFTTHLADAAISSNYPFVTEPSSGWELLSETHYDDYVGLSTTLNADLENIWGTDFYNTNFNIAPDYPQELKKSLLTKGLVTWTKTKVLGTSQFLSTVSIYDEKGRVIQIKNENITGGVDIVSTQYDFSGKVLRTHLKNAVNTTSPQTYLVSTKNLYDDLGRLVKIEKKINAGEWKTISLLEYDAIGQITTKKLGNNPDVSGEPLESLKYEYNIRGWMLGANRTFAKTVSTNTNYFGFDLGYDKTTLGSIGSYNSAQFNGNINGTVWKSKGDGEIRKYDFTYDAVNRLTGANFNQYTGSTFNKSANIDFSVSNLTYDANGNIQTMNQMGLKLTSSNLVDALSYTYFTNSNKLKNVMDASNDVNSKLGDFKYSGSKSTGSTDYGYDLNGNLISDANKAITSIQYNYLNLPQLISITGKGSIAYTYDANGNKIRKVVTDITISPNKTTTTLYLAGVYENEILQFFSHEEGRIRYKPSEGSVAASFQWDYMLKDHLGNVRMVLTEERETKYYPASTLEGTFSTSTPIANSMVNHEKNYYNINSSFIELESNIPSWGTESLANTKLYYNHNNIPPAAPNPSYPNGVSPTSTAGSTKLYKLNATTNKTGLEFMAKVMAGDKIDILGKSYYLNTTTVSNSNSTALDLLSLMTNLLLSPSNAALGKGFNASQLNSLNTGFIPTSFFRGSNNETGTTVPKAYINYIFFDEQFKYAGGNFSRVGTSGVVKDHWTSDGQLQNIVVPKNGYLFVYVSNESNFPVYFDNLQIVHKPGSILEETHYYPYGLAMAGISSKSGQLAATNKLKFNGQEEQKKEFTDESGLDLLDFGHRFYDAQIGRFSTQDWKIDSFSSFSPYHFAKNNPIVNIDIFGDSAWSVVRDWNENDGVKFAKFVETKIKKYEGKKIDCADLAIALLVDYASENGLPLQLTSADGKTTFDSNSDKYTTKNEFKSSAQQGLRAKDISANTNTIEKKDAQPGDMVLLTKPANHVVIYDQTNPKKTVAYGNLVNGKPSPVVIGLWDWTNITRDSNGTTYKYNPDTKHAHRWKVLQKKQPKSP